MLASVPSAASSLVPVERDYLSRVTRTSTADDAGDGARAGLFFETAMRASALHAPAQNDLRVWLACARSRAGDSKGALKLLREAVAAGFDDREFLQEEPSLARLRERPEFQEILRSLPATPLTGP